MGRGRPPKGKGNESTVKGKKKGGQKSDEDEEDLEMIDLEDQEEEEEDGIVDKKMDGDDSAQPALPISSATKRKVILPNKGIVDIGWENIEQVMLNHPGTGQKSAFLIDARVSLSEDVLSSSAPFIFEVLTMEQETRSWFVGDSVVSDGNIYVCSPIDPLFFVLPALMKTTRAMQFKDHLEETIKGSKVIDAICDRLDASGQMDHISKKIVCDDIIAYKFLEDKTLEWLASKAKKTAEFLKKKDITGTEASMSSNFTKSLSDSSSDKKQEEYLRYACEIVEEYVPEILKKKLFEFFGLPFVQEKLNKRKSELDGSDPDASNAKKLKVADVNVQPTEDYGTSIPSNLNNVSSKLSTKEKELQKAAKGTQSLFKFFAAKTK